LIEIFSKKSLWFLGCQEIQFNEDGTFGSYVVNTPYMYATIFKYHGEVFGVMFIFLK